MPDEQLVAAVAVEVGGHQQAGILAGQVPAHDFPPVDVKDDDPPLAAEFLEVDADPARFPSRLPRRHRPRVGPVVAVFVVFPGPERLAVAAVERPDD